MSTVTTASAPAAAEWTPARGGACSGEKPDVFFPDLYDEDAEVIVPNVVKYLCDVACPFGRDGSCLRWALAHDAYGFWAGTSRYQRLQLGRNRQRARCPGCRSQSIMVVGRDQVCVACGISWPV